MRSCQGTALLMVLFCMSFLTIATTTCWYTASLLSDASCVRQRALQRMYAVDGLLTLAHKRVADTFDLLCATPETVLIYDDVWPCGDAGVYHGHAAATAQNQGVKVEAHLMVEGKSIAYVASLLQRDSTRTEKTIYVAQWSIHEAATG